MATVGSSPLTLLGTHGLLNRALVGTARFLRAVARRRMLIDLSLMLRDISTEAEGETEPEAGELRRHGLSRPVLLFINVVWNMAFVILCAVMLILGSGESPAMPLRLWIVGYALQCVVQIVCLVMVHRRLEQEARRHRGFGAGRWVGERSSVGSGRRRSSDDNGRDSQTMA